MIRIKLQVLRILEGFYRFFMWPKICSIRRSACDYWDGKCVIALLVRLVIRDFRSFDEEFCAITRLAIKIMEKNFNLLKRGCEMKSRETANTCSLAAWRAVNPDVKDIFFYPISAPVFRSQKFISTADFFTTRNWVGRITWQVSDPKITRGKKEELNRLLNFDSPLKVFRWGLMKKFYFNYRRLIRAQIFVLQSHDVLSFPK